MRHRYQGVTVVVTVVVTVGVHTVDEVTREEGSGEWRRGPDFKSTVSPVAKRSKRPNRRLY